MAQFDVHRNTGRHKHTIPFVVTVQSAQFDGYRRRVVVPLVQLGALVGSLRDEGQRIVAALDELLSRALK